MTTPPPAVEVGGAWSSTSASLYPGGPNMASYRRKWELFKNIKEPLPLPRG